jgi:hypothetical protein
MPSTLSAWKVYRCLGGQKLIQLLAVHEVNDSSSSSKKRKRNQHEIEQDNTHQQVQRDPQRMSSREMMPPPPGQMRQRDEMRFRAPTRPMERTTQHVHHRVLGIATSQHPSERAGRAEQLVESRVLDMSNPPIRLQPPSRIPAHHVYDRQMNDSITHDQPTTFAMVDRPTEPSSGVKQRPLVDQQAYMPLPARPQPIDHTSRFTHTRDTQQRPMREPLRPVYVNDTGLQTPKQTSYLSVRSKPFVSPLRASQPTAGSVNSPFFEREASISHIGSRQRPPPRGGDMSQTRAQHEFQLGATAKSQWLSQPNVPSNVRDQFKVPTRQDPSSDYHSFEPPPLTATLPYRGFTAASQTSHDVQPSYNSHTYAASMRQPVERQHIPVSRGRITLLPSKSSSQDYELSSIRGLRGGYPQRAEGFSSQQHPGYTGSRPLFSAASRRSVRR